MFSFFYSLYLALFNGTWQIYSLETAKSELATVWDDLTNWLLNALGGEFASLQNFTWTADPATIWALVLAIVTLTLVAVIAYRLVKMVFSIFFAGGRL